MSREKSELALWHDYDILPGDRTIYIGSCSSDENGESGVDHALVEKVIKNLHILDKRVCDGGITIKINSPGGDAIHGLAIYDIIKTCQNRTKIVGLGHVMSMGSVIFQAADRRLMMPNARMMLHLGQLGLSTETNNFYKNVDEFKILDEIIIDIYLKRIKQKKPRFTEIQLKNKLITDWYLSPKEAIEYGLCDEIYGQEKK